MTATEKVKGGQPHPVRVETRHLLRNQDKAVVQKAQIPIVVSRMILLDLVQTEDHSSPLMLIERILSIRLNQVRPQIRLERIHSVTSQAMLLPKAINQRRPPQYLPLYLFLFLMMTMSHRQLGVPLISGNPQPLHLTHLALPTRCLHQLADEHRTSLTILLVFLLL